MQKILPPATALVATFQLTNAKKSMPIAQKSAEPQVASKLSAASKGAAKAAGLCSVFFKKLSFI